MNTYFIPRPSLRGAVLWQGKRRALAFVPSMAWFAGSVITVIACVFIGLLSESLARWSIDHWSELATAVLLANLAAATVVRLSADGIRVSRAFLLLARTSAPLGGTFIPNLSIGTLEDFYDDDDLAIEQWFAYKREGPYLDFCVRCLRPEATAEWLNAQLQRIQALNLPAARVVESRPAEKG